MPQCLGCNLNLPDSRFQMLRDETLPPRLRFRCADCMRNQPFSRALLKGEGTKAKRRAMRRVNKLTARRRTASAARRTAELSAMPAWADRAAIKAVYALAVRLGQQTGVPHHVDHIVPLRGKNVCGLHVPWNLRAIPGPENVRKSNRFEGDDAQTL